MTINQRERENPARPTVSYDPEWGSWWAQGINPTDDRLHCKLRRTPAEAYQMADYWANNGYIEPEAK